MVNSVAFVIETISHIESLKHVPSSITYPIIRLNAVLVVVFSISSATISFPKAFSTGPLSIIVSITGMHFVISIILSGLIYRERLTRLRIIGIFLTIVSMIFLRM